MVPGAFAHLKWSLVPPDFKECLQDIHENFSNLLKSTACKKWTWKILKALDLQEKSFLVWRRFVTSQFCLKNLNKHKKWSDLSKVIFFLNITVLVERIKFGLSAKTCLIVNILFILNPFIWILFTLIIWHSILLGMADYQT